MSVGVLILSHDGIGPALLGTANFMIKNCPIRIKLLTASRDCDPGNLLGTASELVDEINDGDGVLILTDMIGSTPSNIAAQISKNNPVNVVGGLNLSMLIRVMNYHSLDLDQLTEKAVSGGIDGIKLIEVNE